MRAEELLLVQHAGQDAAQPVLAEQGEQVPAVVRAVGVEAPGDDGLDGRVPPDEPLGSLDQFGEAAVGLLPTTLIAASGSRPTRERTFSRVARPLSASSSRCRSPPAVPLSAAIAASS
ncbi:hypothetical protein [Streptomyces sp. SLBN-31]|uniref:hypothetical protein n=1 Tax=Streptomyces sp. SLBN-31 TaxID=2768444 RepID=UPI0028C46F15|nr:hypothetical protein [Streptomyces sp. SLBN-31]